MQARVSNSFKDRNGKKYTKQENRIQSRSKSILYVNVPRCQLKPYAVRGDFFSSFRWSDTYIHIKLTYNISLTLSLTFPFTPIFHSGTVHMI